MTIFFFFNVMIVL